MARYADLDDDGSARFGRVDPFCWVLVVTIALLAIVAGFQDWVAGVVIACVAVAVAVFDSWVNRPDPALERWYARRGERW